MSIEQPDTNLQYVFCNIEFKQPNFTQQDKLKIKELLEKTKISIIKRKKMMRK